MSIIYKVKTGFCKTNGEFTVNFWKGQKWNYIGNNNHGCRLERDNVIVALPLSTIRQYFKECSDETEIDINNEPMRSIIDRAYNQALEDYSKFKNEHQRSN